MNKKLRKICSDTYLTFLSDLFIDQDIYRKLSHLIKNHVFKLKNIRTEIPTNITHLKFDRDFNDYQFDLPSNLIYLEIENSSEIINTLHKLPKLKFLKFGNKFNQNIEGLPSSLKYLYVGLNFQKSLHTDIFPSLEVFIMCKLYNYRYDICFDHDVKFIMYSETKQFILSIKREIILEMRPQLLLLSYSDEV